MDVNTLPSLTAAPAAIRRAPGATIRWLAPLLALLLGFAALGALGWLAWRASWQAAERELLRGADAGAASALRILEAHRLATDVVNETLRGLSDAEVREREQELHLRIAAFVRSLPLIQGSFVVDRAGRPMVSAQSYPLPPGLDFSVREWFRAVAAPDAPAIFVGDVQRGELTGQLYFAVARRREGAGNGQPAGAFDGAITVSASPNALAAAFAELAAGSTDTIGLVRADGQVLARTPRVDGPLPVVPADSPFHAAVGQAAQRGTYVGATLGLDGQPAGEPRLIAFRKVDGLPLYVTLARPTGEIAAAWRGNVGRALAIGVPALLAMAALAWMAWRTSRSAEAARQALLREAERRAAAEAARAEAEARRQAEARFRGIFESRMVGMAVFDLRDNEAVIANDRLREMTGLPPGPGFAWRAVTPPEWIPRDEAAISEGQARGFWGPYEKEYLRPDGTRLPVRISSAPLPGEPGRVAVMVQDISEQREAEARRDLLLREVDHRAKNALATARAALRLTRARSVEEFVGAVDGRIGALAQAMAVLAATGWRGAELGALLRGELAPFTTPDGPRLELDGPPVDLAARAVQPLAMAVHELATNAAKYGALSAREGVVRLAWRVEAAQLVLEWRERGGPAVAAPPEAEGFGSRLLAATVGRQLAGSFVADWAEEGLTLTVRLPAAVALVEPVEAG